MDGHRQPITQPSLSPEPFATPQSEWPARYEGPPLLKRRGEMAGAVDQQPAGLYNDVHLQCVTCNAVRSATTAKLVRAEELGFVNEEIDTPADGLVLHPNNPLKCPGDCDRKTKLWQVTWHGGLHVVPQLAAVASPRREEHTAYDKKMQARPRTRFLSHN